MLTVISVDESYRKRCDGCEKTGGERFFFLKNYALLLCVLCYLYHKPMKIAKYKTKNPEL